MTQQSGARGRERRSTPRSPSEIRLEILARARSGAAAEALPATLRDLSHGGFRCIARQRIGKGTVATVRFPDLSQRYAIRARVCDVGNGQAGYAIRWQFLDPRADSVAALLEEVGEVEAYRDAVATKEQRSISSTEAAQEWRLAQPARANQVFERQADYAEAEARKVKPKVVVKGAAWDFMFLAVFVGCGVGYLLLHNYAADLVGFVASFFR